MDMLNDPMTQKKLGAFYTPPAYCKKATELVKKAIERVPEGNDYVIIDRCAGTGNLEMYLDDGGEDILSHCILSTYELKEWMVLKDRFGGRVRYIIPPIPTNPDELPELNEEGFLSGANALTKDIINNPEVRKYIDNPNCTIILFENPPYIESNGTTGVKGDWKSSYIVNEMRKEISGQSLNDMSNAFIWSGFKYFLRQPSDSFVLFSPIKYWKSQKLINNKFIDGFAFNRKHFHAPTDACISCILWSNEKSSLDKLTIHAYNLNESKELIDEGNIIVKQINTNFSEKYYEERNNSSDSLDGIASALDGTECNEKQKIRVKTLYNVDIIGYMVANGSGFDNPRLNSGLVRVGRYDSNGFFLSKKSFEEKLPMFCASRYLDNYNNWKMMSMVMKSGDKAEQYYADIKSNRLDDFLKKCLIWTCLTHYSHMRSLNGSDGRFYRNELCFDNINGKTTLARQKLEEFIAKGYELTDEEKALFDKWNEILQMIKTENWPEYNPEFTYGLYQIDEEINIKEQSKTEPFKKDGSPNMVIRNGDFNNKIKQLKGMLKDYYLNNLVDTLFEYEFLK